MSTTRVRINFPDLNSADANERSQSLLSDLKQDSELHSALNMKETSVVRTDREAMDFGATLIAVLGTPAIIILARAVKSWAERTGTATIELNGVRIHNVRSADVAAIVSAVEGKSPSAPKR